MSIDVSHYPDYGTTWCPHCSKFTFTTKIEDITYPNDGVYLSRLRQRHRKCQDCESIFDTYEMDEIEFESLIIFKEKISRIRTLTNEGQLDLTLLNKILYADKLIEIDDPEIWERVRKSESEIEDEIFDNQASKEIFSNWDPDLSWTTSDNSENPKNEGGSVPPSDDEIPPF